MGYICLGWGGVGVGLGWGRGGVGFVHPASQLLMPTVLWIFFFAVAAAAVVCLWWHMSNGAPGVYPALATSVRARKRCTTLVNSAQLQLHKVSPPLLPLTGAGFT